MAGASWEGFVIENILANVPEGANASFYRSQAGAEIDLVLEMPSAQLWAVEIKRGLVPRPSRGFYHACEDLSPDRKFVVYSGDESYRKPENLEVMSLRDMLREVARYRG